MPRPFPFPINVGTDICSVQRIFRLIAERSPRVKDQFVTKVLTPREREWRWGPMNRKVDAWWELQEQRGALGTTYKKTTQKSRTTAILDGRRSKRQGKTEVSSKDLLRRLYGFENSLERERKRSGEDDGDADMELSFHDPLRRLSGSEHHSERSSTQSGDDGDADLELEYGGSTTSNVENTENADMDATESGASNESSIDAFRAAIFGESKEGIVADVVDDEEAKILEGRGESACEALIQKACAGRQKQQGKKEVVDSNSREVVEEGMVAEASADEEAIVTEQHGQTLHPTSLTDMFNADPKLREKEEADLKTRELIEEEIKELRPYIWSIARFLAGRWAAKEAAIKAYQTRRLTFQDIEIASPPLLNGKTQKPITMVIAEYGDWDDAQVIPMSISHDGGYATATCLAYERSPGAGFETADDVTNAIDPKKGRKSGSSDLIRGEESQSWREKATVLVQNLGPETRIEDLEDLFGVSRSDVVLLDSTKPLIDGPLKHAYIYFPTAKEAVQAMKLGNKALLHGQPIRCRKPLTYDPENQFEPQKTLHISSTSSPDILNDGG